MSCESVDHAQAETAAASDFLGGEEWFDGTFQRFRRHAQSGIADREHHVMAGIEPGLAVVGSDPAFARSQANLATAWHGVACVQGQVDQRRVQLRGVRMRRGNSVGTIDLELDRFAQRTP